MITDEDRKWAIEQADRREEFHGRRGERRNRNHYRHRLSQWETTRRGFLGEKAFENEFGVEVDVSLKAGGDGGLDFKMMLMSRWGPRKFIVDVKTNSFSGEDVRIRVRANELRPRTIYVGARYIEDTDDIVLDCWEWGSVIRALNEKRSWTEVRDRDGQMVPVINYTKRHEECRSLQELHDKVVLPEEEKFISAVQARWPGATLVER